MDSLAQLQVRASQPGLASIFRSAKPAWQYSALSVPRIGKGEVLPASVQQRLVPNLGAWPLSRRPWILTVSWASRDEFVKGGRVGPEDLQHGMEDAAKDIQGKVEELRESVVSGIETVADKVKEIAGQASPGSEGHGDAIGKKLEEDAAPVKRDVKEAAGGATGNVRDVLDDIKRKIG